MYPAQITFVLVLISLAGSLAQWEGNYIINETTLGSLSGCSFLQESSIQIIKTTSEENLIFRGQAFGFHCKDYNKVVETIKLMNSEKSQGIINIFGSSFEVKFQEKFAHFLLQGTSYSFTAIRQNGSLSVYDAEINIGLLSHLNSSGWSVIFRNESDYFEKANNTSVTVGFYANGVRGKSWLKNYLAQYQFQTGFDYQTFGLSLSYAKTGDRQVAFLDSAGSNTPISGSMIFSESENHFLTEKQIGDLLSKEFILNSSQICIVIVGRLTGEEQKMIYRILERYHQSKGELIIIHNFFDMESISSVQKSIQSDILAAFPTHRSCLDTSGRKCEYHYDHPYTNVRHLIVAKEGSTAGNYYNKPTIERIIHLIDGFSNKKQGFELTSAFVQFMNENLPRYSETPVNLTILRTSNEVVQHLMGPKEQITLSASNTDHRGRVMKNVKIVWWEHPLVMLLIGIFIALGSNWCYNIVSSRREQRNHLGR